MVLVAVLVMVTVFVLLCCEQEIRHLLSIIIVRGDLGSLPIITDMIISKTVIILQYYG